MSTASIDRMRVQVLAPPPGAFVVGVSRLGDARLAGANAVSMWQDLTDKTNSIDLTRGGTVDAATTRVDTGRMSVTLVNPKDPTTDPRYRPSTPIRAVPMGAGTYGTIRAPQQNSYVLSAISFVAQPGDKMWIPLYSLGTVIRWSRLQILDINGDVVAGFAHSDFSTKAQWLASAEASQWTKTGGRPEGDTKPFTLGWGGDPSLGVSCDLSNLPESPYTAIRDMSDLTPGESYTIIASVRCSYGAGLDLPVVIGESQTPAEPLFTGTIEDISTRYSKDGRYDWLTIRAVDRVRDLARTPRYGAVAGGDYGADAWSRRVRSVCASAGVPLPGIDPGVPSRVTAPLTPSAWSRWGSMTETNALQTGSVSPAPLTTGFMDRLSIQDSVMAAETGVQFTARERGVQTTLTGLEPGHYYSVSVHAGIPPAAGIGDLTPEARTYVASVDGIEGTPAALDTSSASTVAPGTLKVFFLADSDTARLRVMRAFDGSLSGSAAWRPENFEIGYVRVHDLTDPTVPSLPPVVDVVYESTVLNHLEMACQSVGVDWWANRTGGISFHFPGEEREVKLALSDASRPSYTAANLSFDTGRIVNQLDVTNHGRQADPASPGNWIANDTSGTYQAEGSVGAFGPRAGSTDLCLPPQMVADRAAQILSSSTSPSLRASSVTVDTLDVPDAAQVDIHDLITVTHRGRTHTYAVAGIHHEISGTKWLTTFELRRG